MVVSTSPEQSVSKTGVNVGMPGLRMLCPGHPCFQVVNNAEIVLGNTQRKEGNSSSSASGEYLCRRTETIEIIILV